jgi:hypothetical protein
MMDHWQWFRGFFMNKTTLTALSLAVFSTITLADTCPTQLHKEYDGHWVSNQAPGWKSSETTGSNNTINTRDFGGAIYDPTQKRMACVYRSNKGFWIALVSHTHKGFQINKHALDDARTARAWRFNKKHNDYSCGRPTVIKIKNCEFTINS